MPASQAHAAQSLARPEGADAAGERGEVGANDVKQRAAAEGRAGQSARRAGVGVGMGE